MLIVGEWHTHHPADIVKCAIAKYHLSSFIASNHSYVKLKWFFSFEGKHFCENDSHSCSLEQCRCCYFLTKQGDTHNVYKDTDAQPWWKLEPGSSLFP